MFGVHSPYPDALLDQIVLVALELCLEARRLGLVCRLHAVYPGLVTLGLGLVWGGSPDAFPSFLIAGNVRALLGLADGCFESLDA